MKQLCLILFLVIATILVTNAQSKMGLGVKGGLNGTFNLNEIFAGDGAPLIGFHGGTYVHYFIFKFLAFQTEVQISQKGEKWDGDIVKGKSRLTYIDVPLLLRFHPTPNNPFFNIQAGPQFGYLIRALNIREHEGDKVKIDIKDQYKDFDIGLVVGFEFNFRSHINLTMRYVNGLSNIYGSGVYSRKYNVLQISAGYRIIGK